MSEDHPAGIPGVADAERLARLEQRLARLEAHLGLAAAEPAPASLTAAAEPAALRPVTAPVEAEKAAEALEFEFGQNGFAAAGIVALTLGGGFMLSLPYATLPAIVPPLLGYAAVAALFALGQAGRNTFAAAARCLEGAAMALLFWSTLRLFFFGATHVLNAHSAVGAGALASVAVLNLGFGWWRRSTALLVVGLLTAAAAPIVVGRGAFVVAAIVALAAAIALARRPGLALAGVGLTSVVYFLWAMGNPVLGGAYHWATEPWFAPAGLLAAGAILAIAPLLRPSVASDEPLATAGAGMICTLGYGTFLLHTAAAFPEGFVGAHAAASALFLGLAILFWVRRESRFATFFYAMTGYAALTMAIVKASAMPDVFVWLSLQSLVVVATAIWFRSRFIVVANFAIYVAIVLGYVFLSETESGISLGFGIVALASARILNWQQSRLELKTGLMRNAYLLSAFFVFPYALQHLVPGRGVALAWVGLAIVYYGVSVVIRNQKYRWMGHGTLLLTAGNLVLVGLSGVEPVYRVLSFLALGTVLVAVSLVFARARERARPPDA